MALNIEALESSFAQVKPLAPDFAASFYQNLFTDYPQLQPLFAHTDMNEQGKHIIKALVLVVENLRQPDVLNNALKEMGARHLKYGTIQEYYPMVGASLLKTFEFYLGANWTSEVKQSWCDAYDAIASIMLQGAKEVS
jgi:hemoglobin-like flavoprotein